MKDRENRKPTTVEEWQEHIYNYIENWVVGSPQHRALNDVINLKRLYMNFGESDDTYQGLVTGDQLLTKEQREDRDLRRIALLEHTIELNSGVLPGYHDANVELNASLDDLAIAATKEAQAKFTGDPKSHDKYVADAYRETVFHAHDALTEVQYSG